MGARECGLPKSAGAMIRLPVLPLSNGSLISGVKGRGLPTSPGMAGPPELPLPVNQASANLKWLYPLDPALLSNALAWPQHHHDIVAGVAPVVALPLV